MRTDETLAADEVCIRALMKAIEVALEDGAERSQFTKLFLRMAREIKAMELPSYSYEAQARGLSAAIDCIRDAAGCALEKAPAR